MYVYIIYMYVCRFACMCVYIDRKRQRGRETEIEKETCFKELAYVGIVKSKI